MKMLYYYENVSLIVSLLWLLNKHYYIYIVIIFLKLLFTCILHSKAEDYVMAASISKP